MVDRAPAVELWVKHARRNGAEIVTMQRSFRVREMYAWVVVLSVTGYALNLVFQQVERRVLHWHRGVALSGAEME